MRSILKRIKDSIVTDDPNDGPTKAELELIDRLNKEKESSPKDVIENAGSELRDAIKKIHGKENPTSEDIYNINNLPEDLSRKELNKKQNKVYDNLREESTPDYLLNDPRVIGYNNKEEQNLLFGILSQIGVIPSQESILDIGCGVGDYYEYVNQNIDVPTKYLGIDINPNMISLAKQKYPDINFETKDLADQTERFDFVVASGLFNLKLTDDMYDYVYKSIDKMYELAKGGVAFNMLSNDNNISPIDGLAYYNPIDIFQYCKEKFNRVILRHDYLDDDFTIFIYK
jgi:SAM-dependent methyltransferase